MTGKLVLENLKNKPIRSLLSIFLIAIPVTLILTLVGLSHGLLEDSARRQQGVGADIFVRPPNTSVLTLSGSPLSEKLVDRLAQVPHVTQAVGMMTFPISQATYIAGVELAPFTRMSGGFKYLQRDGVPFQRRYDVIIDEYYARQKRLRAGDTTEMLGHQWHVCAVVEPGKLSHIIVPLHVLQDLTSSSSKVSQIFLKLDNAANVDAVVKTLKSPDMLPDFAIYPMKEFLSLFNVDNVQGGALRTFINVMVSVGVVIGFAVALLSMYMAVLQRTREIGILKSLGASRWFILKIILMEAVVMGLVGAVVGIGLSFVARWIILTVAPASLNQAIVPEWWPRAAAIALVGVLLGALYPGLSAARQDPIEALAYE